MRTTKERGRIAGLSLTALLLGLSLAAPAAAQSTELASISTDNVKANDDADGLRFHISSDGRFVTFMSEATNLVTDDGNDLGDIFVRDRVFEEAGEVVPPDFERRSRPEPEELPEQPIGTSPATPQRSL